MNSPTVNRRKLMMKIAVLVTIVVAFVLLETQLGLPSRSAVQSAFDGLGWMRGPAFVIAYAAVTLLPLPKAVFTIVGGAIFGFWAGLLVVVFGAVIGSSGAFALARWLGRQPVRGMAAGRVAQLDGQVGRHGFLTVFVARLIPVIPFTTINYVFGLTAVTFASYVNATAVGILPGTAIYVAVGAYGFSPGSWPFFVAVSGLVVLSIAGAVRSRCRSRSGVSAPPGNGATK